MAPTMRATRVHRPGGPEALVTEDVPVPGPAFGEARVRIEAAGVNYIDTYHRTGAYALEPPFTIGSEAAGIIDAVGEGVDGIHAGDRVAWTMHGGAYAEQAVVPASKLVKLPDTIATRTAAASLLQGMTAHYLTTDTFHLGDDHTCLIHAAAGGVGQLLVQMAKQVGATVFGTVSTQDKADLVRSLGCNRAILYAREDFEAIVRDETDGRGVDVVYDSVGRTTFDKSLASLRPRGLLALFGQSSGAVPPLDPQRLNAAGSVFLTRPSLVHYINERHELEARARALFHMIEVRGLNITIDKTFPLEQAADAHRYLEARKSMGKVLLVP